jgi:NADP-dependent 3-hydroxy acid dehydrogenase YdfG
MDWEDQQALVAGTLERFGTLDVAVANAGIGSPAGFADGDPDRWRALVLTNVYGVALTVRAALPIMLRRSRGHIVLIGSTAGRVVLEGSLYSATKWAVAAIGEAVRQEVAGTQVRVSVVHPGFVDTAMFARTPHLSGEGPLRPDDVASAILHVLSQPERLNVSDVVVRPTAQPVGPIDLR